MPQPDMRGKVCLVTGASSGIGKETALGLARLGATVLVVARDLARGQSAVADIRREAQGGEVTLLVADLASLADVRQLAVTVLERYNRLDVLINNAGVAPVERQVTREGLEMTFATNYLGPFLLTNLLLARLRASTPARIVNVASDTHRWVKVIPWDDLQGQNAYNGWAAYNLSKLLNVLFTFELAEQLNGTDVIANCLHPGWPLKTALDRDARGALRLFTRMSKFFGSSAAQGAKTSIYLASSPEMIGTSGRYFTKCRPAEPSALARDPRSAKRLWRISAELCADLAA